MYNQIKYYVIIQKALSILCFLLCIYLLLFYRGRIISSTILLVFLTIINAITVFSSIKKKKERMQHSFDKLGKAKLSIFKRHVFLSILLVFASIVRLGLPIVVNYI